MAKDIDQSVRTDLSTKQSQIKVVTGREPSIAELTENKPVMRYVPGTGLMMYVRYNNKRYHVKFSDDPRQEGKIRVEDLGQNESISMQFIRTEQGGTGQDLSNSTGAISISDGTVATGTLAPDIGGTGQDLSGSTVAISVSSVTVSAGTLATSIGGTGQNLSGSTGAISVDSGTVSAGILPVNKGGTAETDSNTWLNSRVKINANGTLSYDNSTTGAVTMNTLTDDNDIRSRVVAGLDSSGNVDRTVSLAKGGLGADVSSSSGFVKLGSGSATIRDAADTKSDLSLNNVANERQINTFAQDGIPTSVAAGDIWVDTDDDNKMYRAASAGANEITGGEWVAVTPAKGAVGLGSADNLSAADIRAGTTAANVGLGNVANERQINTFVASSSSTIPTAVAAGDLWVDSGADNKLYRAAAAGANEIASGEWILVQAGKTAVGLGNVDNTSDSTKQTNILSAATKSDVGLANVDNTSAADLQTNILSAADADDVGLGNVANVDTRNLDNMTGGTLAVDRGGTGAGNSNAWLNSRIEMNTNGTLDYSASGSGAVTMNTLTDANNIRARVTGSLASTNGLNTGVAIGDAVQTAVLYNGDTQEARTDPATADHTITNSNVWQQDDDTQIIKISFDYLHNSNNRGLKLSCLLRSSSALHNAVATLSVYNNTVSGSFTSGSLPDTSGSPIVSVALSTNKLYFDSTHTSSMLGLTTASGTPGTGEVADGTLYKITIGLHSADDTPSAIAYMSAPTVTVFGSTS